MLIEMKVLVPYCCFNVSYVGCWVAENYYSRFELQPEWKREVSFWFLEFLELKMLGFLNFLIAIQLTIHQITKENK
jgi:hypothetical protein